MAAYFRPRFQPIILASAHPACPFILRIQKNRRTASLPMAADQQRETQVDPKLLEGLSLYEHKAQPDARESVHEYMSLNQAQDQVGEPHTRALNPYAAAFLPLPVFSGTYVPLSASHPDHTLEYDGTLRNNHAPRDTEKSQRQANDRPYFNPSQHDAYRGFNGSESSTLVNHSGRPAAPSANLQTALRYNPSSGFVAVNPLSRESQPSNHPYNLRSLSSAGPSRRELAGRNGVPIPDGFFTPSDPSLADPDYAQKQARSRQRPRKPPKPAASQHVAQYPPSEPFPPLSGPKPVLGSGRPRHRYGPPEIVEQPPQPTPLYAERACAEPRRLATPQRLLLVLDLNGTLLERNRRTQAIKPRHELQPFLAYCLRHHDIMIWSSATPDSVRGVCDRIFSAAQRARLVAVWARDTLGLSPKDYNQKVQVYKRLDRVWEDQEVQSKHPLYDTGGGWDQSNTLLIDDSALKAAAQPWNHVKIPEFVADKGSAAREKQAQVFGAVAGFLHELRMHDDVSRCLQKRAFRLPEESGLALPRAVLESGEDAEGWAKTRKHVMILED